MRSGLAIASSFLRRGARIHPRLVVRLVQDGSHATDRATPRMQRSAATALELAGLMTAGATYEWLVSKCWPQTTPRVRALGRSLVGHTVTVHVSETTLAIKLPDTEP